MTTATLDRIKARVLTQIDAYHEACRHADAWARVSGSIKFVVRNDGRYFLADWTDLRAYHRRDIYERRANVVYIGRSMPPTFAEPIDLSFTSVGWPV